VSDLRALSPYELECKALILTLAIAFDRLTDAQRKELCGPRSSVPACSPLQMSRSSQPGIGGRSDGNPIAPET